MSNQLTRHSLTAEGRALKVRLLKDFEREPRLNWMEVMNDLRRAGLSFKTISDLAGCGSSTVRTAYWRAVREGRPPSWYMGRTITRLHSRLCGWPMPTIATSQVRAVPRGTTLRSTDQTVSSEST